MYPEVPFRVTYNDLTPWGTGYDSSVPYVSVDVEEVFSAGQVGFIRTVTLNGTIPSGGTSMITGIRNAFVSNFKPFVAPNITMPNAMVQEITFGSQNYIGKVDYSIILKDFSGYLYGVSNPVDEVSFQQEQDGTVTVSHKISAIGVTTTQNSATALANAKSFVVARTGVNGTVSILGTSYVPSTNKENLLLLTTQESINRALSTYSIAETYKYDPLRDISNNTLKRFSIDINSGIGNDYVQVAVNGTYLGGKDRWDSGLFAQVAGSELFTIASGAQAGLNPLPLSFAIDSEEVTEGLVARSITARATYDNSPQGAYFEYDFDGNKDFRNGQTQVSVKGIIVGSGRHVRRRFDSALSFFNSTCGGWDAVKGYLYRATMSGAVALGYSSFAFNPIPKSFSVIFNSGQGVISMNASFDDMPFVSGYSEFGWTVNADCGLNIFKPHASANKNGSYLIQDLGILNRTSVTINGSFAFPATGTLGLPNAASANVLPLLREIEGQTNAYLESQNYNINSGEAIKTGFSYQYTRDGAALGALPVDGRLYKGISI